MPADEPDIYLAILKASYDYEPQSDDEIAIKEDQLLLLVERVDDEWWKVKIKAAQDSESPTGLVPAAYVEQAEHTSVVRALYDYDPTAPGELSLHEDDMLYVFDTEDDWLLVQNSKEGGHAGYVPGNYVEVVDENEPPAATVAAVPAPARIIVPDSPPRPVATYVDPADRVAQTRGAPAAGDDIQTWSVSEIDKKGKKKKGTLGVGNGAVFFASESDKTPVQKWQTKDVTAVSSEKSKHIRIDIDGPTPTSLHFHAGSKDNVDAIMTKLESSKALSSPSSSSPPVTRSTPTTSEPKKASVHFSSASPVIIPEPDEGDDDVDDGGDEEPPHEEEEEEPVPQRQQYTPPPRAPPPPAPPVEVADDEEEEALALYDFTADGEDELSVTEGEKLAVLEKDGDEWWKCRNAKGQEGVVPASYLEAITGGASTTSKSTSATNAAANAAARAAEAQKAEEREAERARQQAEKEAEAERAAAAAARKAEAAAKAKQAALASEAQRQARVEAAASARVASPPAERQSSRSGGPPRNSSSAGSGSSKTSTDINRPPPEKTRVWHDRSGQFRVEAAFLGFNNGKLRLHKVNGVIVEVPSEKMSLDDMRYVERFLEKNSKARPGSAPRISEDDIPLALNRPTSISSPPQQRTASAPPAQKKAPKIDWFDFFLSAGCDLDDCTRYAASFERDKIDETLLADITESTMRSLGLREGDIIRVKKAIEKRKPDENLNKPSAHLQEQLRRDEELARQLQAQENSGKSAPHLFTEPGGTLKPRRGRPQPKSSVPLSAVDIKAIASPSNPVQRTASPQMTQSPGGASSTSTPVLPARPGSAGAAPLVSRFDDDAWTNRPSSTKPVKAASPAPASAAPAPAPVPQPTPTVTVAPTPPAPAPSAIPQAPATMGPPSLAKTTESDIFEQLAKLSVLRQNSTPAQPPQQPQMQQIQQTPSPAFNVSPGMGLGPSPVPMGQHFLNPPRLSPAPPPQQQQQPYNGPRGPFAPVPTNQNLLQPLIPVPTQPTGFNTFIPTKAPINSSPSPFGNTLSPPAFLSTQPTGYMNQQPLMNQPTGYNPGVPTMGSFNPSPQPLMSQPTGAFGAFGSMQQSPFQGQNGSGFGGGPIQSQMTGFNPPLNQSMFGPGPASPPPLPSNPSNSTSPANVFAQMKSGTFANDNDNPSHGSNSGLNGQTPVWGQTYQGYTGY